MAAKQAFAVAGRNRAAGAAATRPTDTHRAADEDQPHRRPSGTDHPAGPRETAVGGNREPANLAGGGAVKVSIL